MSVKSVAAVESSSITLDVLCYQSKYTSNFKTETAIDCDREMKQEILCNDVNSEKIIFDGLSCGTSYNISIYWRSPDQSSGVHCLLFQKVEQTLQCKDDVILHAAFIYYYYNFYRLALGRVHCPCNLNYYYYYYYYYNNISSYLSWSVRSHLCIIILCCTIIQLNNNIYVFQMQKT